MKLEETKSIYIYISMHDLVQRAQAQQALGMPLAGCARHAV